MDLTKLHTVHLYNDLDGDEVVKVDYSLLQKYDRIGRVHISRLTDTLFTFVRSKGAGIREVIFDLEAPVDYNGWDLLIKEFLTKKLELLSTFSTELSFNVTNFDILDPDTSFPSMLHLSISVHSNDQLVSLII